MKADELLENTGWKKIEISTEQMHEAEEALATDNEDKKNKAQKILNMGAGKWRMKNNEYLTINLTTVEKTENEQVITAVKNYWEAVGVKTNVLTLPASQVQMEIIKPREFEAFFYSQIVGADPDPYAFWHSSQSGENGFNISSYINKEVDELLEDARLSLDMSKRQEKYKKFQEIIVEDEPAIFMYSPNYVYIQEKTIKGFDVKNILIPCDRFANINAWYIKTGKKLLW
jgi:peptide/nickel transport system substrate-binding protein